jgi:hypothetical protein
MDFYGRRREIVILRGIGAKKNIKLNVPTWTQHQLFTLLTSTLTVESAGYDLERVGIYQV